MQGLRNAGIGELIVPELIVAEATVETHVGRRLTKLGLRERVRLVPVASEAGR